MSEKFELTYYIDDGYANPGPQSVEISDQDLEEDMSENDIEELLDDYVQTDFEQTVSPFVRDEKRLEFMIWARERIAAMAEVSE